MEQGQNHLLEAGAKVLKTRWFFGFFTVCWLDARTEEAAENALDFDP
jgi:hypothetical protein